MSTLQTSTPSFTERAAATPGASGGERRHEPTWTASHHQYVDLRNDGHLACALSSRLHRCAYSLDTYFATGSMWLATIEHGAYGVVALRHVLLDEPRLADAVRVALHRDGPGAQVCEHQRRDRLVVRSDVALRDPVLREQHLFGMRDDELGFRAHFVSLERASPIRERL